MGKLRACFVVAVSALGACGDDGGSATVDAAVADAAPDAKVFMDAPPPQFDLACAGNTAPTDAPANIALSGFVQQANVNGFSFSLDPVEGAEVNVCTTTACNGTVPTATTDASGDWAIAAVPTNDEPLTNGYLEMTAQDVRTTYVYPGAPFRADQAGIPVLTFGDGAFGFLESMGCTADEVVLAIAVTDCSNMPISDTDNINITIRQGGNPVQGVQVTDVSSLPLPNIPPQVAGLFIVCNVPASDATEVSATYNGTALLAHNVKTVAGTTTTTQIRPGY